MWISIHKSALSRHTVCRLSVVPITIIIFITIRYDAAECRYYSDFSIRQVISIDTFESLRFDFPLLASAANEPPKEIIIIIIVVIITHFI